MVNKTKKNLEKLLISSRQCLRACSPKSMKKSKTKKKTDTQLVQISKTREEKSKYSDILNSFLNLKQGKSNYTDIVVNAMNATDNILALKCQEENSKDVCPMQTGSETAQAGKK